MSDIPKQLISELDALWRFALRLTANEVDAEDLVQRTCVKALENTHQYQDEGKLRSWLFRIEHRIWLNVLRSRQIRNAGSFHPRPFSNRTVHTHSTNTASGLNADGLMAEGSSHDTRQLAEANHTNTPESQLQLHQVFEQVESLPEAQRLVMILVCVEGFTYQETADILEIPAGTVMSRLARARITLGQALLHKKRKKRIAESEGGIQQ